MSEGEKNVTFKRGTVDAELSERGQRLAVDLDYVRRVRGRTRQAEEVDPSSPERSSALARGFQLSSEFVVSVLVGAAIGWGIDHFLPTSPWGLVVFLLLGFVAGVVALIRSVARRSRSA